MNRVKTTSLLLLCSLCSALRAADTSGGALTIAEVLRRAEQASPELNAVAARESQAREGLRILESLYYPSVEFQVIQSYGYAGSNGALGASGLISSPFRVGPGAELVSKLSLVDHSRTYGVRAARDELRALEEQTRIVRYRLDQAMLEEVAWPAAEQSTRWPKKWTASYARASIRRSNGTWCRTKWMRPRWPGKRRS